MFNRFKIIIVCCFLVNFSLCAWAQGEIVRLNESKEQDVIPFEEWNVKAPISCSKFLQADKDEKSAKSRIQNAKNEIFYNFNYGRYAHYVLGIVTGINMSANGVTDVLPLSNLDILDMVKKECEIKVGRDLDHAVYWIILENKKKWKNLNYKKSFVDR